MNSPKRINKISFNSNLLKNIAGADFAVKPNESVIRLSRVICTDVPWHAIVTLEIFKTEEFY